VINIVINGNTQSLKKSVLKELEDLFDLQMGRDELLSEELALRMAVLTSAINREIAVYIDRKGTVVDVSIGNSSTVTLSEIEISCGRGRLSGIRCVHTHPNGNGMLSSVDVNALLKVNLDAMTAIGVYEGCINEIYTALPVKDETGVFSDVEIYGPFKNTTDMDGIMKLIYERDRLSGTIMHEIDEDKERAVLVGLEENNRKVSGNKSPEEISLDELEELAATAGAIVLRKIIQKKSTRDAAYFIGKGKIEEIVLMCQSLDANLIIFDDELTGAQVRNIENATGMRVIDRTTLILDIFAKRAKSREGKLQVELAQLKYRLPRLTGMGTQLSRLGGGIGTRGPGEKKLEVDKRHIRTRIKHLENELSEIKKRRNLIRSSKKRNAIPSIALVGYTNTGKSTLMNRLCNADVLAENKLFATLDPTARLLELPDGRKCMLIDTVGFIRKLPHDLVDAFKSTLEEAVYADVLLHVADLSNDEVAEQIEVVNNLLDSLGATNKPIVLALNKTDICGEDARVCVKHPSDMVYEISALTGEGIDNLLKGLAEVLPSQEQHVVMTVPYSEGWVISYVHDNGKVIEQEYTEEGIKMTALLPVSKADRVKDYIP